MKRRTAVPVGNRILVRARGGDRRAIETFFAHYLPQLRAWTRSRVPRWLERRVDADDLVQLAAIKTLRRLHHLSPERRDSIQPYLRQIVLNLIRDEVRAFRRAPEHVPIADDDIGVRAPQLDRLVHRAAWRDYCVALNTLSRRERRAVIGRLERGLPYEQLRRLLNVATANTARVATTRAIHRLVARMVSSTEQRYPQRETRGRQRRRA